MEVHTCQKMSQFSWCDKTISIFVEMTETLHKILNCVSYFFRRHGLQNGQKSVKGNAVIFFHVILAQAVDFSFCWVGTKGSQNFPNFSILWKRGGKLLSMLIRRHHLLFRSEFWSEFIHSSARILVFWYAPRARKTFNENLSRARKLLEKKTPQ